MRIYTLDLNFQNTPHVTAAYLVVGPEGPVLVESGPGSTLENLHARLAEHGYEPADIQHVLITHIHLDHAGAAGWWGQQGAQVYVHYIGAPHLIDPAKLLSSAKRIYGDDMDVLWGTTMPVPTAQLTTLHDGDRIQAGGLTFTTLDTPGHASHHHVFRLDDIAFAGDAAGATLPDSPVIALHAPPPEFDLEAWHQTIARLLDEDFTRIYTAHFGPVDDVQEHLEALTSLLSQSAEFVRNRMRANMERDEIIRQYIAWHRERAVSVGLSKAQFQSFKKVSPLYMSVDGIMRYWRKKGEG